ncbi:MAG: hypothetical protein KY457_14275 [Actinobacteria bacterium]|nr:hypothetical protein [Actinomycetota bacterium]
MPGRTRPRLCQVVFDTTDARASAEFWRQLLGLVYPEPHRPPPSGEDDPDEPLRVYADPAGRTFCVFVGDTAVLERRLSDRGR